MSKNGIDRIGGVLLVQFRDSHSLWKFARVPNFQAVFEQHHLYTAVTCIVAVYNRINNSFGHGLSRQFGGDIHLRGMSAFAHVLVNAAHHKPNRHIHHLENGTSVYLL